MLEKGLQTGIIRYLNGHGCYVWNVNAGKIRASYKGRQRLINLAPAGHSDIQGVHIGTGRFIAIEVKSPHRKTHVTDAQWSFLETIKRSGGIAGVATSPEEALEIVMRAVSNNDT